jgi:para-aminobenzoate synthetase / 4-amino-4-deoxychorismate lyase
VPAPTALIDFIAPVEGAGRERLAFFDPLAVLEARTLGEVQPVLEQVEAEARQGRWCVGFVAYEAAPAFDTAMAVHPSDGLLAWFGVFDQAHAWPAPSDHRYEPLSWNEGIDRAAFERAIDRIHAAIADGEVYQINFTAPWRSPFRGDPHALFQALHRAQPDGYAAFLDTGTQQVLSVSPELFFDWRGGQLLSRPMKGTAARDADPQVDARRAEHLRTSEKERAENLMIVDLLRNDLSRVAQLGTVRVPRLFELHALPTVWQMTSTVTAVSRTGLSLVDAFAALFPCGSVTGAPKIRAMQIIRELEGAPRGWYCGALGLIQPGGVATFNVPIRTVEFHGEALTCGIGSAITLDSEPAAEIAEWRAKSRFLARAEAPVEALETLRLEDGVALRGDAHLARMQRTARHFGLRFSMAEARSYLQVIRPAGSWRLRLTCDAEGRFAHTLTAFTPIAEPVRLALADRPIATRGPGAEFLAHKTTRREAYAFDKPSDVFDVILWNEAGELTECSFGNLAVQLDGRWLTPPLDSGLLPGVLRAELLAQGRIKEARLTRDDLARAEGLAFFNSLRGWLVAELA